MHVAHVIPYLGRAQGGPVFGLAAYSAALAQAGCQVAILGTTRREDGDHIKLDSRVSVRSFDNPHWGAFRRSSELSQALVKTPCEIIHSHGLWTDAHRLAAVEARKRRLPHVLAPCGMLAPGALAHHWWKKLPAGIWFQARALREASCLHAKSELEYGHIRRAGLRNPVTIVPNPICLPPSVDSKSGEEFRGIFLPGKAKILLFLGRLHPVKGVRRLMESWAQLHRQHSDWALVLAGPDQQGHRRELESLLAASDCAMNMVFTGELDEEIKWSAYAAASLFVMPSDFENFGNSIVEAMLSGLPVVTTTGTPWKELPAQGAGWCVPPTTEALTRALAEALTLPALTLQETGRRAAAFAEKFRPERLVKDLIRVYEWLLGRQATPNCVRLD